MTLRGSVRAAVGISLVLAGACSPPPPPTTAMQTTTDDVEQRCEASLARLDALLASRALEADFPQDRLIEARALRSVAIDVTTSGDFDTALQLLDRALTVLSTP